MFMKYKKKTKLSRQAHYKNAGCDVFGFFIINFFLITFEKTNKRLTISRFSRKF